MARSQARPIGKAKVFPVPLGDSHNFGRRVVLDGESVHKPRAILWEWLLLAAKSPLRRLLEAAAEQEGLAKGTFDFLPDLRFAFARRPEVGGIVERVALAPLPRLGTEGRRSLARVFGRAVALFTWLGVSDLHWENLALGIDRRGHTIFAPLDVEMVLADLSLPAETKLLPDADPEYAAVCRHAAGARRVLPYLGKPVDKGDLVAMAAAYHDVLTLLDRHARSIAAVFASLPRLRETPIRICLRGTGDYVHARTEPVWPPLLGEEIAQLARGDIPYFFRLYGRPGIHFYADAMLATRGSLPRAGDVPHTDPVLQLSRGMRSPTRRKLREEGLFTLLGAFDDASFEGAIACDGLRVDFRKRTLVATFPGGAEITSRRDLRGFVESVYLPCRCGEVKTPLVPAVTVCEAGGTLGA